MSSVAANERRAKRVISRLVAEKKMSMEGANWLTTATDPFHDTETPPTGYPDTNSCNTITQCFTYTRNCTNPGSSGTWDAHVFLMPISRTTCWSGIAPELIDAPLYPYKYLPGSGTVVNTTAPSNYPRIHGGYNAICVPSGTNPFSGTTPVANISQNIQMPLLGGQYRVVAAGFEIVNTSPELYKGGSLTCWRTPFQRSATNGYISYQGPGLFVNMANWIPETQAEAQLYPNSKTWAAGEGVYSIATNSTGENPFLTNVPNTPFVTPQVNAGDLTAKSQAGTGVLAYTHFNSMAFNQANGGGNLGQMMNFDYHGAIVSGLDPNANLQITVKYFVERIPTIAEPDLLVLSRAPTPYDPLTLEIYSRCMQELSVGVPVGENPLGEWFNDVLEVVSEWAPKLGNFIGGPANAIGTVVGGAASTALSARRGASAPKNNQPRKKKVMPKTIQKGETSKESDKLDELEAIIRSMNKPPRKSRPPRKRRPVRSS